MQGTEWGQDSRRVWGVLFTFFHLGLYRVTGWKRAWISGGNLEGGSKAEGDPGSDKLWVTSLNLRRRAVAGRLHRLPAS